MKKLMLVAAVMIASVSAHASKARLSALQSAGHLSDIRNAFDGKAEETVNYEAAIVEFGTANGDPNSEGGFIRKMGDSSLGFYVGKPSATYKESADTLAENFGTNADEDAVFQSAVDQENPFIVTYASKAGDMAWGLGLFYAAKENEQQISSNAENLGTDSKVTQNIMGIYGGVNNGVWNAQLRLGLGGETKITAGTGATTAALTAGNTLKGTSTANVLVSGGYKMDTMYVYGSYETLAGEVTNSAGTKLADTSDDTITVGVVNSMKKDGVDFFYGASIVSNTTKDDGTAATVEKNESMLMPIIVGVEADVNAWMVLRGAVTQNFPFLSTSKIDGATRTAAASTTSTLGAGFKWGKATIDTVMGMGTSGDFVDSDGGEIFTNASLTYTF